MINNKYWLKGGVIVIILYGIYFVNDFEFPMSELYWRLLMFVVSFLAGAIIGWIYGKLKNKNI